MGFFLFVFWFCCFFSRPLLLFCQKTSIRVTKREHTSAQKLNQIQWRMYYFFKYKNLYIYIDRYIYLWEKWGESPLFKCQKHICCYFFSFKKVLFCYACLFVFFSDVKGKFKETQKLSITIRLFYLFCWCIFDTIFFF